MTKILGIALWVLILVLIVVEFWWIIPSAILLVLGALFLTFILCIVIALFKTNTTLKQYNRRK